MRGHGPFPRGVSFLDLETSHPSIYGAVIILIVIIILGIFFVTWWLGCVVSIRQRNIEKE